MSHTIEFFSLLFEIENDRIRLKSLADYPVNGGFAEVTVSGENKHTHQGATMIPSSEGARLAYDAMMDALDLAHDDFASAPKTTVTDFPGDLDALLTPTLERYDENVVYTLPGFTYTSNYATAMDLIISTAAPDAPDRAALIFRDSFGSALIPYFSASFADVRYERANPYRLDQLARKGADVVIVEIAERNLRDLIGADERVKG